ncbi:MAG: hypothetical protein ACT4TC_25820, partial [Myxococcaceae bacterium]
MSSRIALVFALTLASPSLQAAQRSESHEVLRGQCLLYAADPTNAWALAHGITGLGKTFATRDGRKATEVVITDYLESAGPGEGSPYRFAKATPDGTPVEPHTNLIPKTLVLAGVPPSTEFK